MTASTLGPAVIIGNLVHLRLRRRFPLRKAAPGAYKVVAQLPERDGQVQYRIKSDCEPFSRTVSENELDLHLDAGAALTGASSSELQDQRAPMRGASK
jgi:hypothetical protein